MRFQSDRKVDMLSRTFAFFPRLYHRNICLCLYLDPLCPPDNALLRTPTEEMVRVISIRPPLSANSAYTERCFGIVDIDGCSVDQRPGDCSHRVSNLQRQIRNSLSSAFTNNLRIASHRREFDGVPCQPQFPHQLVLRFVRFLCRM